MKKVLVWVAVVALMLATAVPAFAADGTATVVVTGGSISVTPKAITFTGVTLDGTDHNDVSGSTTAWDAEDPTGTGAGWHVDVASTGFTNAGNKTIAVTGFDIQLLDASIAVVAGNTKPTSSVTAMTNLSATPVKICSAALDTGMGSYTLLPTFQLDVPAETYAGTYTATVTLTITASP